MNNTRSHCPSWCDKLHPGGCGDTLHDCECSHTYLVEHLATRHGSITVEVRVPAHDTDSTPWASITAPDYPIALDRATAGRLSLVLEYVERCLEQLNTDPADFEPLHLTERS